MLAVLLVVALGAADVSAEPKAIVLVSRRSGLAAKDADALARAVSNALVEQHVPLALDFDAARTSLSRLGLNDAAACNGRMRCVAELARQLSASWIITISLARVGDDRSIGLELIHDGAVLEREALVLSGTAPLRADDLAPFAGRLQKHLGSTAPPPEPVKDVPVVTPPPEPAPLTPKVEPTPPVVISPPAPPARGRVVPIALGVGAGAALVAGAVLTIVGATTRAEAYRVEVVDGVRRSPHSASETRQLATDGTAALGVGVGLGAVALGLGTAAVFTW